MDRRMAVQAKAHGDEIRARAGTLYEFIQMAWPILEPVNPFVGGWMIEAICQHLEAVTRGDIQYLLINVPPGCMKSLLVSVLWPAWEWGPMGMAHLRFLTTSFSEGNVLRDNQKMRRVLDSQWFRSLWPDVQFAKDQNAKGKFENTKTGGREGRAFESMTGGRGDRVLIDDPHSVDSAESDVVRKSVVQTFRESITDRLNDVTRSAIVIIMQRLHEEDVSGAILDLNLPYVHLNLPMEFDPARKCTTRVNGEIFFEDPRTEDGELLFENRFPRNEVEAMKIKKGEYAYAGQYQQLPAPREGGMFNPDLIEKVPSAPLSGREVRGWDIAGSKRKTSPYTVGLRLRLMSDNRLCIMHVERGRYKILEAEQTLVKIAKGDEGTLQSIPQDPGSAGLSQKAHLSGKLHGCNFKFSTETGKKEDRAVPIAAQVNAGNVCMVKAPWNAEFIAEMRNFPNGSYKDQIDALSRAYSELIRFMEDEVGGDPEVHGGDGNGRGGRDPEYGDDDEDGGGYESPESLYYD